MIIGDYWVMNKLKHKKPDMPTGLYESRDSDKFKVMVTGTHMCINSSTYVSFHLVRGEVTGNDKVPVAVDADGTPLSFVIGLNMFKRAYKKVK